MEALQRYGLCCQKASFSGGIHVQLKPELGTLLPKKCGEDDRNPSVLTTDNELLIWAVKRHTR